MELKNSDGIISTLFHYIWKRPDNSMTKFRIKIPHTILFHEYSPAYWYFSNKNGEISKRYESSINTEAIYKTFTRKPKRTEVVAVYLSVRKEFNKMTFDFEDELYLPEGLDKIVSVQYVTKNELSIIFCLFWLELGPCKLSRVRQRILLTQKQRRSMGFCRNLLIHQGTKIVCF